MIRLTTILIAIVLAVPLAALANSGMATEALQRWRATQEMTTAEAAKALEMDEGRYVQLEAGALPTEEEAARIEAVAAVPTPWWGGFVENVPDAPLPAPPPPRVIPQIADRVSTELVMPPPEPTDSLLDYKLDLTARRTITGSVGGVFVGVGVSGMAGGVAQAIALGEYADEQPAWILTTALSATMVTVGAILLGQSAALEREYWELGLAEVGEPSSAGEHGQPEIPMAMPSDPAADAILASLDADDDVAACLELALQPVPAGGLSVRVVVSPDGKVPGTWITTSGWSGTEVSNCLAHAIQKKQFNPIESTEPKIVDWLLEE
jgi:hypothetical protein